MQLNHYTHSKEKALRSNMRPNGLIGQNLCRWTTVSLLPNSRIQIMMENKFQWRFQCSEVLIKQTKRRRSNFVELSPLCIFIVVTPRTLVQPHASLCLRWLYPSALTRMYFMSVQSSSRGMGLNTFMLEPVHQMDWSNIGSSTDKWQDGWFYPPEVVCRTGAASPPRPPYFGLSLLFRTRLPHFPC